MSELCPFCRSPRIFVGVHDDEGNYHGHLGCEYETAPWSGLSYALHHEGWGECILCTDGENEVMGGMLFDSADEALTILRQQEPKGVEIDQLKNAPLSLEELRKIAEDGVYGAHIWVKDLIDNDIFAALTDIWTDRGVVAVWAASEDSLFEERNYGRTWVAYSHKPEVIS